MRHLRFMGGLGLALLLAGSARAQIGSPLPSTEYTRGLLTNTTAADARTYLEVALTNGINTNWGSVYASNRFRVLNVRDFGAVGDGVTDDTAPIQEAIDATTNLNATSTVYLPAGDYAVSTLYIRPNQYASGWRASTGPLRLTGDGRAATRLLSSGGISALVTNLAERLVGFTVENLGLIGPLATSWNTSDTSIGLNVGWWYDQPADIPPILANDQYRGLQVSIRDCEISGWNIAVASSNVWVMSAVNNMCLSNRSYGFCLSMTHSAKLERNWVMGQQPLSAAALPDKLTGFGFAFIGPDKAIKTFGFGDTGGLDYNNALYCTNAVYNSEVALLDTGANYQSCMRFWWIQTVQWPTNWNGERLFKNIGTVIVNPVFGDMDPNLPSIWTNTAAGRGQIVVDGYSADRVVLWNWVGNVVGFGGNRVPFDILPISVTNRLGTVTDYTNFNTVNWPQLFGGGVQDVTALFNSTETNSLRRIASQYPATIITNNMTDVNFGNRTLFQFRGTGANGGANPYNPLVYFLSGGQGNAVAPAIGLGADMATSVAGTNWTVGVAKAGAIHGYTPASGGYTGPNLELLGYVASNGVAKVGLGATPGWPATGYAPQEVSFWTGFATNQTASMRGGFGAEGGLTVGHQVIPGLPVGSLQLSNLITTGTAQLGSNITVGPFNQFSVDPSGNVDAQYVYAPNIAAGIFTGGGGGLTNLNVRGVPVIPPDGWSFPVAITITNAEGYYLPSVRAAQYLSTKPTTYYLATNGSDAANGLTVGAPKATLSNVCATATGPFTCYISAGVYGNNLTTTTNLLVLPYAANLICSDSTATFGGLIASNSLYLEGITLIGQGGSPLWWTSTASTNTLSAVRCTFTLGTDNGLSATASAGLVVLENCIASSNAFDGFNYHGIAGQASTLAVVELDCSGSYNGTNGVGSNNGSTIHEGVKIVRCNGRYFGNENRNIHDIGTNGMAWLLGCEAGASMVPGAISDVAYSAGLDTHNTKIWLYDCGSSAGSTRTYVYPTGATITDTLPRASKVSSTPTFSLLTVGTNLTIANNKVSIRSGAASETITITNGRVGIVNVSPATTFDVNGNIYASAAITSAERLIAGASSYFQHSGRNRYYSPADGVLQWTDSATNVLFSVTNGTVTASNFVAAAGGLTLPVLSAAPSVSGNNGVLWLSNSAAPTLWITTTNGTFAH